MSMYISRFMYHITKSRRPFVCNFTYIIVFSKIPYLTDTFLYPSFVLTDPSRSQTLRLDFFRVSWIVP